MAVANPPTPPPMPQMQSGQSMQGPGGGQFSNCPPGEAPDGSGGCRKIQGGQVTSQPKTTTAPPVSPGMQNTANLAVVQPQGQPQNGQYGPTPGQVNTGGRGAPGTVGAQPPYAGGTTAGAANKAGIHTGNIAEWAFQNINSDIPKAQWDAWVQHFDPNCPPGTPFRSQKVDGGGRQIGTCEETPDNCPHGTTAFGKDQCLPVNDQRIQAAWGGGAGGAGGVGTGGGSPWEGGGLASGWGLTPEELEYLSAITGLGNKMAGAGGDLFRAGLGDRLMSGEYYRKVMGAYGRQGVQSALAPIAETIEETTKGARAQLRDLRGGARDAAESELARQEAGQIGGAAARLQPEAAAELAKMGEAGISQGLGAQGQAAGVFSGALGQATGARQFEEQLSQGWNIAALQAGVSREAMNKDSALGWAQLAQRGQEFQQNFGMQTQQFQSQLEQWEKQFGLSERGLSLEEQKMRAEQKRQKGSFLGNIFSGLFGIATTAVPGGSLLGKIFGGGGDKAPA